jgi:ATP-dependent RNA helicase DDX51/DBP6
MTTLEEEARNWKINEVLIEKLKNKDYKEFFSVQREVIPVLVSQNMFRCVIPQDICVSAPTGSGKTLSYALPIVNSLLKKEFTRLRALILLPSRELAVQVFNVFQELVENTDVKVMLSTSNKSFEEEQWQLVGYREHLPVLDWEFSGRSPFVVPQTGISLVDILIATPGRLLDHIHFTPGFTLEHLRFLVLDEADRLLSNAYHTWVRTLITSTVESSFNNDTSGDVSSIKKIKASSGEEKKDSSDDPDVQFLWDSDGFKNTKSNPNTRNSVANTRFHYPLQRLLFSATLTDNPSALASLGIVNPLNIHCKELYSKKSKKGEDLNAEEALLLNDNSTKEEDFFQEEIFDLPELLSERILVIETQNRLLKLLGVLLLAFHPFGEELESNWSSLKKEKMTFDFMNVCSEKDSLCMIFVNSSEASHRLTVLLKLMNNQIPVDNENSNLEEIRKELMRIFHIRTSSSSGYLFNGRVEEMTHFIKPQERERIISDANRGEVAIIVSSDRMARGIDLPSLKLVVNYDLPKSAKTYIHRAGRTARAGRKGMCLSMMKKGQVQEINNIRDQIRRNHLVDDKVEAEEEKKKKEEEEKETEDKDGKQKKNKKRKRGTTRDNVADYFQLCYMSKNYLDSITPFYEQSIQLLPALLAQEK